MEKMGIGDEVAEGGTAAMRAVTVKAMQILYDILKNVAKLLGKGIVIGGKQLTKDRELKIKGEISVAKLNKLLERTGRGKQLMTVPEEQLAALEAESRKHGIPFAVIRTANADTVQIGLSDRDAAAFSDICRNVAMRNLTQNPEKYIQDMDNNNVDPDVAKQIYARADIPQMTFRKADGSTITQVEKAHEKAYLKAKNDMVIPLSRDVGGVQVKRVDEDFVQAIRAKTAFVELDKQEAYGVNFGLAGKSDFNTSFLEQDGKVILTFPLEKADEIAALRAKFAQARSLADKVKTTYDNERGIVKIDTGDIGANVDKGVFEPKFEIQLSDARDFQNDLAHFLQGVPEEHDELFKQLVMRDINKNLQEYPAAVEKFNYDIFENRIFYDQVPYIDKHMENISLAKDILKNGANKLGGELSDTGGVCVFDQAQKEFRVISPKTKEDVAKTLENSFRYGDIKAGAIAEKVKRCGNFDVNIDEKLESIQAKNPLLSDCMLGKFDGGYSLFNTIGAETVGYVIAGNDVSRTEIEMALADTLKIDDPAARAELMSKLDEKGILPVPKISELEDKTRGKIKVRQTTKDYCSVEMTNGETVLMDKAKASPEAVAERFALDRNVDKGLIKSLTRAVTSDGAKGKTPLSNAIEAAVSKSNFQKENPGKLEKTKSIKLEKSSANER
jgi:ABC-type phosphate transport system auxiliary subunit